MSSGGELMYEVYTAGATNNPGPIGVGVVMVRGDRRKEIARGGWTGTNAAAALRAVIVALEQPLADQSAAVIIYSNHLAVVRAMNGEGSLDAQRDLLDRAMHLARGRAVVLRHLANREQHPLLLRAQELARSAL